MSKIPELVKLTNDLSNSHLGYSIDLMCSSKASSQAKKPKFSWVFARRQATSSVLHAYMGFESIVNKIGYDLYVLKDSPRYIPEDKRNLPLRRFVKAWDKSVSIIEKFEHILEIKSVTADQKTRNELGELNNLRNMLVHGVCYQTTILVNPETSIVEDREDTINWKNKFPNTKFNPVDQLDYHDAVKAIEVVFKCLRLISVAYKEPITMEIYYNKAERLHIFDDFDNTKKFFESFTDPAE